MYIAVDCSTTAGSLVWFEPNPHVDGESWNDSFIPFPVDLRGWLERWLDGEGDLFEQAWDAVETSED